LAQDDYYYEIQLTNKQLVFYFLAGATGLILSFLAGVMVGRGVDATPEVQAARVVKEDRIVPEESPRVVAPSAEPLTYASRLEGEKPDEGTKPSPEARKAPSRPPEAPPRSSTDEAKRNPPTPKASPKAATSSNGFAIQVMALKDKRSAESLVSHLKEKGFAAYIVTPAGTDGGFFNVRVGSYPGKAEAERAKTKLQDEEKFTPFIIHP